MYAGYPGESSETIRMSNYWYAPEEYVRRKSYCLYESYPLTARCVWIPISFLTGAAKGLLFPAFAVVGAVAMPIIAAICFVIGRVKEDDRWYGTGKAWLKAWGFCLLTVGGLGILVMLHTYYFPLMVPATLLIAAVGVSIAIHIYRALLDPPELIAKQFLIH